MKKKYCVPNLDTSHLNVDVLGEECEKNNPAGPSSKALKFRKHEASSKFSKTLSHRVNIHFQKNQISKHANAHMLSKSIFGLALWILSYLYLISANHSTLGVVFAYLLHGCGQLYIAFNIAHDANHGAYARSRVTNRVLGCIFDLVGVSSYMWRLMHNDSHHSFVNIRGADTTFICGNLFRFSPQDRPRPHHRFQHIYAIFFYSLVTLDWVLFKDYRWLWLTRRFGNKTIVKHPLRELVILFVGKAFYYGYMLVIPLLYLQAPWYSVILGFVAMHLFLGLAIAVVFQPNHFVEGSSFPEPDHEGMIANDYIRHVFDTTSDYSRKSPFMTWILGGLNLHVIHHMFPGICHVHYGALTEIVMSTAREHGLEYREKETILQAFIAHLQWLKALGRPNDGPSRAEDLSHPRSSSEEERLVDGCR